LKKKKRYFSKEKILIIGYGSMGKKYEFFLKKNFEIFYYDKKKIIKKNFLKNLKNIRKQNFLFSIISTPANTHKYYVKIMVNNDINFMVEKPLSIKTEGWKSIIEDIKQKKLICCVAYPRRNGEAYNYIKSLIYQKKIIGKLKIIRTNYSQDFRKYRKDYKKIYYKSIKTGGGIVFDALTHHLNLISFFAGNIKNINVFEKNLEIKNVKVPDTCSLVVKMFNGIYAFMFGNQFQKPNVDEIEFIGTNGNLKFERISNKLIYQNEKKIYLIKRFKETYNDMFKKQILNYIRSIKSGFKVSTSIEEEYLNIYKLN
jgi:predicted dehydrogenase